MFDIRTTIIDLNQKPIEKDWPKKKKHKETKKRKKRPASITKNCWMDHDDRRRRPGSSRKPLKRKKYVRTKQQTSNSGEF